MDEAMRVCWYDEGGEGFGGMSRYLRDLIVGSARLGVKGRLISESPAEWHDDVLSEGVELQILSDDPPTRSGSIEAPLQAAHAPQARSRTFNSAKWAAWYLRQALRLRKIFRDARPDILHVNAGPDHPATAGAALHTSSRTVLSLHSSPEYAPADRLASGLYRFILRTGLANVDRAIAVSEYCAHEWRHFLNGSAGNVVTQLNGIDTAFWSEDHRAGGRSLRQQWGMDHDVILLISVGRFSPIKNHSLLLAALPLIRQLSGRDVRCMLVGGGELEGELRSLAQEKDVSDWLIVVPFTDDLRPIYAASDAYVHCTAQETFGLAIAEAMGAGKPAICPDRGGFLDFVRHDDTGFLYRNNDVSDLVSTIVEAFNSRERLDRIAMNGTRWVRDHLTIEQMVRGTLDTYRGALHRSSWSM